MKKTDIHRNFYHLSATCKKKDRNSLHRKFPLLFLIFTFSMCLFTGCRWNFSITESESAELPASANLTQQESSFDADSIAVSGNTPDSASENDTDTISDNTSASDKTGESSAMEELQNLDNTVQNWGQGVQFNDQNQPVSSVDYHKKYENFQADFIGPDEKVIWLTFDEGYENGYTESILDTLKEKDCSAVFFITGQYAQENPDLINRMISEGHVIGNHSWAHPSNGMPSLSIEDQIADMEKLHNYVKDTYNYDMTLFRFPAGIFSEQSLAVVQNFGYHSLFWSFAYADWDPQSQPDQAATLTKLCERLHPGSIYLLHAVSSTNAAILGDFIDQARADGYTFALPQS